MVIRELSPERRPKAGSNFAKVYDAWHSGEKREDLPLATGISKEKIGPILRDMRHRGYLPPQDKAEKFKFISEPVSLAKGGIGIAIKPYAAMRMSSREISLALEMFSPEKKYFRRNIAMSLKEGRKRGKFPKITPEDQKDIHLSSFRTDEELRETISIWLRVKRRAELAGENLNKTRLEWKQKISEYQTLIKKVAPWAEGEDDKGLFCLINGEKRYKTVIDSEFNLVRLTLALALDNQTLKKNVSYIEKVREDTYSKLQVMSGPVFKK